MSINQMKKYTLAQTDANIRELTTAKKKAKKKFYKERKAKENEAKENEN